MSARNRNNLFGRSDAAVIIQKYFRRYIVNRRYELNETIRKSNRHVIINDCIGRKGGNPYDIDNTSSALKYNVNDIKKEINTLVKTVKNIDVLLNI